MLTQYTTDNITSDSTPSFTVALSGLVSNALVTVTAAKGTDSVSRTVIGVSGATAAVEFAGSACDSEDAGSVADEPCELGDGVWSVTAVVVAGSQTSPVSAVLEVTIDTVAPTVAAFVDDRNLAVGETATLRFMTSEPNVVGFDPTMDSALDQLPLSTVNPAGTLSGFDTSMSASGVYTVTFTAERVADYSARVRGGVFTDIAGNANVLSNRVRIAVGRTETTDDPEISLPTAESVVGRKFRLSGMAEANAKIDVTSNSVGVTPVSADWLGNWSAVLDVSRLADGPFMVSVRATRSGKVPSGSVTLSFRKNTAVPEVSVMWGASSYAEKPGPGDPTEAVLTVTSTEPAPLGGLEVKVEIDLPAGFSDSSVSVPSKLTIPHRGTSVEWSAAWQDDQTHEANETISAEVTAVHGDGYAIGLGYLATAMLVDNDAGGVYFVVAAASGDEDAINAGGRKITFVVKKMFANSQVGGEFLQDVPESGPDVRVSGTSLVWRVDYSFTDGTAQGSGPDQDYIGTAGTLVFQPDETEKQVIVDIADDTTPEQAETFMLTLTESFPNPSAGYHFEMPKFREDLGTGKGHRPENPQFEPVTLSVVGTIDSSDGGVPSAKPTLVFGGTGAVSSTPNVVKTNDNTPAFTVGNVQLGATVTVTAVKGVIPNQAKISRTYENIAANQLSSGSLAVPFSGNVCDDTDADLDTDDDEPCALAPDGEWIFTAIQTETGKNPASSDPLTRYIDTTAPVVTATPAAVSIAKEATVTVMLSVDEDIVSFPADAVASSDTSVVTITNLTGSGRNYNLVLTGVAGGTATISLVADKVIDAAGNTAAAVSSLVSVTVTAAPSITPTVTLQAASDTGSQEGSSPFYTMSRTPYLRCFSCSGQLNGHGYRY